MIAAEYPPCSSAGVQRTYHFSENLLKLGWQPLILTAHKRIYKKLDPSSKVSPQIEKHVYRAAAADASVHFAIGGKYFGFLENPDKFSSWYLPGYWLGKSIIKKEKPDIIWSTFPVLTSHRIAKALKTKSNIPWVADFRDPLSMHYSKDNSDKTTNLAKRIDKETIELADALVFATVKMCQLYKGKFPRVNSNKFHVIENGYDEASFSELKKSESNSSSFTLLYSGALYPNGRDPKPLFKAISELLADEQLDLKRFKLCFRGSGSGEAYYSLLEELNIRSLVEFLPPLSHQESLQEMIDANGLLVIQGDLFNNQIPGKVYEYLAAKVPILGLIGQGGATEALLKQFDHTYSVPESDINKIKISLLAMMKGEGVSAVNVTALSRRSRALQLEKCLSNLLKTQPLCTESA